MFAIATGIFQTGTATIFIARFIAQLTPDMLPLLGLIAAGAAIGFVWRHFKGFAGQLGSESGFIDFDPFSMGYDQISKSIKSKHSSEWGTYFDVGMNSSDDGDVSDAIFHADSEYSKRHPGMKG
jgi:hypothetical protein